MTTRIKPLLQAKYAENSQTTQTLLSSAGSRVMIDKFSATNVTGSNATIAVAIVPSGQTYAANYLILQTKTIQPGETYNCPELVGQALAAGDFFSLIAGTASAVVIRISGREITD